MLGFSYLPVTDYTPVPGFLRDPFPSASDYMGAKISLRIHKNLFVFNRRFLDIFFEIFGCARQYEQALLHSFARKFGCARHSPNKFGFCARLAQTLSFLIKPRGILRSKMTKPRGKTLVFLTKPRGMNDFVKPNEQSSSLLEYSAMARIFVQVSAIELAHIAERSRKCQKKIALLRRILYTHFFTLKNPSALHKLRYLIEHKHLTTEGFATQTLQQPFIDPSPTIHRHKGNMNAPTCTKIRGGYFLLCP